MQRTKKLVLSVLILTVVLIAAAPQAAASGLPDYFLIGETTGLTVTGDGVYLIDAPELKPGDTITKQLLIRNLEPYTFRLSLRAEPMEETGPLDLLDEVRLTLTLDGHLLYDGRVRGDEGVNMILTPLDLGLYPSGAYRTLDIVLTVDSSMSLHYESSEAFFRWIFHAVRYEASVTTPTPTPTPSETASPTPTVGPATPLPPVPAGRPEIIPEYDYADDDSWLKDPPIGTDDPLQPKGPATGDNAPLGMYIAILGISMVSLALLLLARRKKNSPEKTTMKV